MGKIRKFLGFFVFLVSVVFGANAFATEIKTFCIPGYYLSDCGTTYDGRKLSEDSLAAGNSCVECPEGYTCTGGLTCPVANETVIVEYWWTGLDEMPIRECVKNMPCNLLQVDMTEVSRAGKYFAGWTRSSTNNTVEYTTTATINTENDTIKLYAVWLDCPAGQYHPEATGVLPANRCETCPIGSYARAVEGAVSKCSVCSYGTTSVDGVSCDTTCSNAGQGIRSWTTPTINTNENGLYTSVSDICTISSCSSGYYRTESAIAGTSGKCEPYEFKVTFRCGYTVDGEQVCGIPDDITVKYNEQMPELSAPIPERPGYVFKGWWLKVYGQPQNYQYYDENGQATGPWTEAPDSIHGTNFTLYAGWEPVDITITYAKDQFTMGEMPAPTVCKYDQNCYLAPFGNTFWFNGGGMRVFSWMTKPTTSYVGGLASGAKTFETGSKYTFTEDMTLYPMWGICTFDEFNPNVVGAPMNQCMTCPVGSRGNASTVNSGCDVCPGGTTGAPSSSSNSACQTSCPNAAGVATWKTPTWEFAIDNDTNKVVNKCAIETCQSGYTRIGSADPDAESSYQCVSEADLGYYAINLNLNGGTITDAEYATQCNEASATIDLPAIERTGYTFDGWYNSDDVRVTEIAAGTCDEDQSFTAKWTQIKYIVTYEGCGTALSNGWAYYGVGYTPKSGTVCSKPGYVFKGWAVSGTEDIKEADVAFIWEYTENKTFTAQWTSNTSTVTYAFADKDVSGIQPGGTLPEPTVCAAGQSCQLAAMASLDFYRGGHKLIGWSTTNSDTNTTAEYTTTGTFDKDTTLYAVWEPCGVDTYHPDAAGMPANVCETCAYGSQAFIYNDKTQCTACANGFTGVGCKDKCPNVANVANVLTTQTDVWIASTWNSDNTVSYKCSVLRCDGGYSITSDTDEYDPDADSNGTCEPITRELKFSLAAANATWADPTDADKTIEITFNGTLPELPLAQPSRNGYTFKGWWGDSQGNLFGSRGIQVYDENGNPINEVLNDSKKFSDIVINRKLSAKWEPNPVTITYSAGNFDLIGTLPQPTTCYYEQSCKLAPLGITFNRKGGGWRAPYWYDAEDRSATYEKYGTFTKDTTLIPYFGYVCAQGRFVPGDVGVPVDRCQICASGSYDNSSGTSSGCIACAGGTTTDDSKYYGDTPPLDCPETCPNSDGVESWVTPEWSYTIDADAIDMSAEDPYANVVTNKVTNKCTIDTCKSGYKRVGSYDPDAESNYVCAQDIGNTYFDIEYDYAGGYLSTAIEVVEQCNMDSDEITLPTNLMREGYTFAGWDNNGETVTTIPAGTCDNDITLTAKWTPNTYTVTYAFADKDVSGIQPGGTLPEPTVCAAGQSCQLAAMASLDFYRGGHKLIGWSTTNSGTNTTAQYTTTGTFDKDTTLYAVWEQCGANQYHPDAPGVYATSCLTCADGSISATDKTKCDVCSGGRTGTKCEQECPNNTGVTAWGPAEWVHNPTNDPNTTNLVKNKCYVSACSDEYILYTGEDHDEYQDTTNRCISANDIVTIEYWWTGEPTQKCVKNMPCNLLQIDTTEVSKVGKYFAGWSSSFTNNTVEYGTTATINTEKDTIKLYAVWLDCPAGQYHPKETGVLPANQCATCPNGSHSYNFDVSKCLLCSNGTTSVGGVCNTPCPNAGQGVRSWISPTINTDENGLYTSVSDVCKINECKPDYKYLDGDYDPTVATGKCEPIQSTITFDCGYTVNNEEVCELPTSVVATVGQPMPELDKPIPTRAGYTFVGWYNRNYGNSLNVMFYDENGKSVRNWGTAASVSVGETNTLYAGWEPIDVTITYVPDEYTSGTVPEPTVCKYMQPCKVAHESKFAIYYKDGGKYFADWQDENGKWYYRDDLYDNVAYKLTEDVTVHPAWAWCPSASFYPKEQVIPIDRCLSCPTGSHVNSYNLNTGCTVCPVGTTTTPGSNVLFKDGCKKTCPNAANVATWQKPTWDFSIDSETRKVATNKVTNKCTIVECEDGYKRVGSYDPDAESNYACVQDMGDAYFDIEYDYAGGYLNTAVEVVAQCNMDSDEITLPTNLIRTGYTFAGWDNNGETVTTIPAGRCDNDIKLTAQWTPNTYTVTYEGCDSITTTDEIAYDQAFTPKSCSKFGYDLHGWAVSGTSDIKNANESFDWEYLENKTLTAQWVGNGHYWITYDPDGGTFDYSNLVTECTAESDTIVLPQITKDKHNFAGWFVIDDTGSYSLYTEIKTGECTSNMPLVAVWHECHDYNVLYNANGGNGTMYLDTHYYGKSNTLKTNEFTRDGYTFAGWSTSPTGAVEYHDGESVTDLSLTCGPVTLYAVWVRDGEYAIQYKTDGGRINDSGYATQCSANSGTIQLPTNVTRAGYTFDGWYNSSNSKITEITGAECTGQVTLTAKWTPNTYTVTYEGCDSITTTDTATYGKTFVAKSCSKSGLTFDGWVVSGEYNDVKMANKSFEWTYTENKTFTAQWIGYPTYNITYDANGGTIEGTGYATSCHQAMAKISLPLKLSHPDGLIFDGWLYYDAKTGEYDSVITLPGTACKSDIELTATWKTSGYRIEFNANGGTGTMPDDFYDHGTEVQLPPNTFVREGYTFTGWNTMSDGTGTSYADQETVIDLKPADGMFITLYAQWAPNTSGCYKITLDANGGTYNGPNPVYKKYDDAVIYSDASCTTELDPQEIIDGVTSPSGYNLVGFTNAANKDKQYITSATTISPLWRVGSTVLLGASNVGGAGTLYAIYYKPCPSSVPNGSCLFSGGYQDGGTTTWGCTYTTSCNTGYTISGNGTANPVCSAVESGYTIYYATNGGTINDSGYATQCSANSGTITLPTDVTRAGYTFDGWYNSSNSKITEITGAECTGQVTLTAKWTPCTYTVTFNANGGNGTMNQMSLTYDINQTLPNCTFTRDGYVFVGWNTLTNGTGMSYTDGQVIKNLTPTCDGSVALHAMWAKGQYKISYVLNGGANYSGAPVAYDITTPTITLGTPTRANSVFEGWYTDAAFTTKITEIPTGSTGDKTLYAKWSCMPGYEMNSYGTSCGIGTINIIWNNGGHGTTYIPSTNCLYGESVYMPVAPSAVGYAFDKWSVNNKTFDANEKVSCSTDNFGVFNGPVTVSATWTPVKYNVTYSCGYGVGTPSSGNNIATYDASYTPSGDAGCSRDGYNFAGWMVSGTNDVVQPGAAFQWTYTENKTFAAYWVEDGMNAISYNTGGGKINDSGYANKCNAESGTITLPINVTRDGYVFDGWFRNGERVSSINAGHCQSNMTFTAKWTPCTYDVVYNANGGNGGMAPSTHTYDIANSLTRNAFTRDGYMFKGWSTVAGGDVVYQDGASVKNLTSTCDGTVNLYAVWGTQEYTIKYEMNGGKNYIGAPSSYNIYTPVIQLGTPTRANSVFEGWYTDAAFTTKITEIAMGSTGNKTLYAKWSCMPGYEMNSYGTSCGIGTINIIWNNGGHGTVTNSPIDCQYGGSVYMPIEPYAPGYDFVGWTVNGQTFNQNEKVSCDENVFGVANGRVEVIASWRPETYTISYVLNGGNYDGAQTTYDITTPTITLGTPTCANGVFDGWYTDASFTTKITQIPTGSTGNKTLYAKWLCNDGYHLNNNACVGNVINLVWNNGGIGVAPTSPASCTYGQSFTMPNAIIVNGYVFQNWTMNNKSFAAGQSVMCNKDNTGIASGTANVTAMWERIQYNVTYSCGDGVGTAPATNTATYGMSYTTHSGSGCTRNGYTFAGWRVSDTQDIRNAGVAFEWTYLENKTLIAQWRENDKFQITYDVKNGKINDSGYANKCNAESGTIILPTNVTRDGYVFDGWFRNGERVLSIDAGQCQSNMTFTAQWTPKEYTVTYICGDVPTQDTARYDSVFTPQKCSRNGYKCIGWSPKTGSQFIPYDSFVWKYTEDMIFSAYCTVGEMNGIIYNANGGKTTGSDWIKQCNVESDTITIPTTIARDGYVFDGWYYNGKRVTEIKRGECVSDITLDAKWTPCTYTVTFNANGGSGTMNPISLTYDKNQTLPNCAFTRDGYVFVGWNTLTNGSAISYNNGQVVKNLTPTCGGSVALHAIWSVGQYKISYDLNGGLNYNGAPVAYDVTTPTITLGTPTRANSVFEGWYTDAAFKTGIKEITMGSTGNKTLYAKWSCMPGYEMNSYGTSCGIGTINIIWNNGGHGTTYTPSTNCLYGGSVFMPVAPYAPGYDFVGWTVNGQTFNQNEKVSCDENVFGVANGRVEVTALWRPETYTISYNMNGGINPAENPESYTSQTPTITLKTPTKPGYVFTYWTNAAGKIVDVIETGSVGDITLKANWAIGTYGITYELNGGVNNANNPDSYVFNKTPITLKKPSRVGYVFDKWVGDYVVNNTITDNASGNLVITATWKPKTYTINLNKNNGYGNVVTSVKCTYDSGICELPSLSVLKRDGYVSKNKWCENADGSGACYDTGVNIDTNISSDGTDTILYAKWTPDVFKIDLVANDATDNKIQTVYLKYATGWFKDSATKSPIALINTNALPVKSGYAFAGFEHDGVLIVDTNGELQVDTESLEFTTHDTAANVVWEKVELKCKPGFEPDEREENCVECPNTYDETGKVAVSSWVRGCEIASCLYHGELYNLYNNECVQICPYTEHKDETGSMKWDDTTKKCKYSCIPGYIKQ